MIYYYASILNQGFVDEPSLSQHLFSGKNLLEVYQKLEAYIESFHSEMEVNEFYVVDDALKQATESITENNLYLAHVGAHNQKASIYILAKTELDAIRWVVLNQYEEINSIELIYEDIALH